VDLTLDERKDLKKLISSGEAEACKLTRARILLKADEGWTDKAISEALDVGTATVGHIRKRFVETGLEAIHRRKPRRKMHASSRRSCIHHLMIDRTLAYASGRM